MNSKALDDSNNSDSQLHSDRIYGVFGESDSKMTLTPSSAAVVYGFAGGEYDAESGRYYFRARVYDPETGRWMSKDPIGFSGGDTNLFTYVKNDPINKFDPSGLTECPLADEIAKKCHAYRTDLSNLQDATDNWDGEDPLEDLKNAMDIQAGKLIEAESRQRDANDACQAPGL